MFRLVACDPAIPKNAAAGRASDRALRPVLSEIPEIACSNEIVIAVKHNRKFVGLGCHKGIQLRIVHCCGRAARIADCSDGGCEIASFFS